MITTQPMSPVEMMLAYIEDGKSLEEFFADFPAVAVSGPERSPQLV